MVDLPETGKYNILMNSIINQIYLGLQPQVETFKQSAQEKIILGKLDKAELELQNLLSAEQLVKHNAVIKLLEELDSHCTEMAYTEGFKFGFKLALDIFR